MGATFSLVMIGDYLSEKANGVRSFAFLVLFQRRMTNGKGL